MWYFFLYLLTYSCRRLPPIANRFIGTKMTFCISMTPVSTSGLVENTLNLELAESVFIPPLISLETLDEEITLGEIFFLICKRELKNTFFLFLARHLFLALTIMMKTIGLSLVTKCACTQIHKLFTQLKGFLCFFFF